MVFKSLRAALFATAIALPAVVAAPAPSFAQDEDPVVARVGDQEIRRSELQAIKQGMAEQVPQVAMMPMEAVFQPLVERAIDSMLLTQAGRDAGLADSEEVQKRLEDAKSRIIQQVYLEQMIDEELTDARIQEAYEQFKQQTPEEPEVSARHILVETEEKAQEIIDKLEGGADFAELAKTESTGPSGAKGGELGWFKKGDMVEPFAAAAFAMEPGDISESPVQTQFGWHVIKVEDRRTAEAPPLEQVEGQLRQQLAQTVVAEKVQALREDTEVEIYGPTGKTEGDSTAE
ncbi:PpiC-type peptidyl-prolyl cis-trans isomerase [Caenispirillum salinarum AK4]|uniref:Parvulin-like PPIase n=1 Tax=Caenispirillum salinarum AK4 TaxID=1238182 RepID=K9HQ11_9PROT|nr:peptidylprolyl isomerase [Caenispirillum salinarum]EKV30536.1 PpiC-type peptidyl-prolyl cis-trans isomerase [Caenispirillum salinarum AK4]